MSCLSFIQIQIVTLWCWRITIADLQCDYEKTKQPLTHKDEKWKYIYLNPSPPTIIGLIKIRKTDSPIRPIINWKNAPAYKLTTKFSNKLEIYIPLPHIFNVKGTTHLMKDLLEIPLDKNLRSVSFDIMNTYSNVLVTNVLEIIELLCSQNGINKELQYETTNFCKILIKQNYFQYRDLQYIQENGLAMGAPSSIFPEIYLKYLENTKIFDILVQHHIIGYFQYADDILIVYKNNVTNIHTVLTKFNNMTTTTKFTMEEEYKNKISFLDITISKDGNNI